MSIACLDRPDALGARIVAAARALTERGLVVGTTGNVSARLADRFFITPTRMSYEAMSPGDLIALELDAPPGGLAPTLRRLHRANDTERPVRQPSLEWPMHRAIYRARRDVHAVVHTHSLYATAWSFLGEPLQLRLEDSRYYGLDSVGIAPPAGAGSPGLAEGAVIALGAGAAALLASHGTVTVGRSPEHALAIAEVIEREAHTAWLLRGAADAVGRALPAA